MGSSFKYIVKSVPPLLASFVSVICWRLSFFVPWLQMHFIIDEGYWKMTVPLDIGLVSCFSDVCEKNGYNIYEMLSIKVEQTVSEIELPFKLGSYTVIQSNSKPVHFYATYNSDSASSGCESVRSCFSAIIAAVGKLVTMLWLVPQHSSGCRIHFLVRIPSICSNPLLVSAASFFMSVTLPLALSLVLDFVSGGWLFNLTLFSSFDRLFGSSCSWSALFLPILVGHWSSTSPVVLQVIPPPARQLPLCVLSRHLSILFFVFSLSILGCMVDIALFTSSPMLCL
eukprot:gene10379-21650_t